LSASAAPAMEAYCRAYCRWQEAEQQIRAFGVVLKSPAGGLYQSPFLAISNRAMDRAIRLAGELGLTPEARARLKAPEKPDEDPFAAFLAGRQTGNLN